jgi:uncharacterized protein YbjT (DUF2867 family)
MTVAVVGGTGLVGQHVVDALRRSGHEPVVVARSTGADALTGDGLADALAGAEVVVDVLNFPATDSTESEALFGAATAHLLAAETATGVRHHVLLSILGLDRVGGNPHYAGKRVQEALVLEGPIPATILRAAMFHEFPGMVVSRTRQGDVATVPPLLIQPVAASDVGRALADIAVGEPRGMIDLAGPEPQDFVDMARRTLTARGESIRLVPTWQGQFGAEMAGEILLPGPDAVLEQTTFDEWLAAQSGEPEGE